MVDIFKNIRILHITILITLKNIYEMNIREHIKSAN